MHPKATMVFVKAMEAMVEELQANAKPPTPRNRLFTKSTKSRAAQRQEARERISQ